MSWEQANPQLDKLVENTTKNSEDVQELKGLLKDILMEMKISNKYNYITHDTKITSDEVED